MTMQDGLMKTGNGARSAERGMVLLFAILLIMVMTVLGMGLIVISEVERDIALHDQRAKLAREIAQSALMYGKMTLKNNLTKTGDGSWDDDLSGTPLLAPPVKVEWKCTDVSGTADVRNECRDCLRASLTNSDATTAAVSAACVGKMKGMPIYDYQVPGGAYLIRRPVTSGSDHFRPPVPTTSDAQRGIVVKGYYTLWVRDNPNDRDSTITNRTVDMTNDEKSPGVTIDRTVVLIAEAWVKKRDEQLGEYADACGTAFEDCNFPVNLNNSGTAELRNPVVGRAVLAEIITQGELERFSYPGKNVDQHNTNTIYATD